MNQQNSKPIFHLAGFTLIETVIVIVLVGILAAVAIITNPFASIKLTNSAKKVTSDIRYVQKLAISNQTRAGITFNTNGYDVYSNISTSTRALSPGDTCSSDSSNNFIVDFTQARCGNYQDVQITSFPATNPIAFNSLGVPVDSGGTALSSNQTVTISYSGNSRVITIEFGTGRIY